MKKHLTKSFSFTILTLMFAIGLHAQSVQWEIFKNKLNYNFTQLHQSDTIPDLTINLTAISTSDFSTGMDRFASRIRGYLIPPDSGIYTLYFACDDVAQFWLSPDSSETNAALVFDLDTTATDWTQNTASRTFAGGHAYYFEILHYDSVYTDQIRLGWMKPGDSIPVVVSAPYISASGNSIGLASIIFQDTLMMAYAGWNLPCAYTLSPWNTTNKTVLFESSNTGIATINNSGVITAVSPGNCIIRGISAADNTISDSLLFVVSDYYGPFFVKPDSMAHGNGHSWDNAISLTKLLDFLNHGIHTEIIRINVAEGNYKPTYSIDRNISFRLDNVILKGGYSINSTGADTMLQNRDLYPTILSGEIGNPDVTYDNSYHVVYAFRNVVIDGVTIRDGRASCSSYGWTPGFYQYKPDDNGGGICTPFSTVYDVLIKNSVITNNSAWNSGGGILCGQGDIYLYSTSPVKLINTEVYNNKIEQEVITTGGIFNIQVNGNGAAISAIRSKVFIENCIFYNNRTDFGYGKALYCDDAIAKIKNSSVFDNSGTYEDIWLNNGSNLTLENSTVDGSIVTFFLSTLHAKNSTITSGGYSGGGNNIINITNSIWSGISLSSIPDTNLLSINYSIIGDVLLGGDKEDTLISNLPNCMSFLDTIANNGGPTPTMRLKNIPANPAKSMGNPLYLDSLDQRGYIRKDSISIGAYQWIRPDSISVAAASNSICQGDSAVMDVIFFPPYVDDSTFLIQNINDTIAFSDSAFVHALSAGNAQIVVSANDGNKSDTLLIDVIGTVGTGIISGDSIVCQGDGIVVYQVTPIENATAYVWALPSGASGNSSANTISVDFDLTATSGPIAVSGQNACFSGLEVFFPVLVNDKPATPVISIQIDTLFSNAASGNQWYDDNGSIAGANNQYYIVTENGNYYVVVSNDGCNSDPSNIITIINVGLNENDVFLSIYPNPATEQITIAGIESGGILRLYDLTGKLLLERENRDNTLDVSGVEAGCYVLEYESGNEVLRGRVVVKY